MKRYLKEEYENQDDETRCVDEMEVKRKRKSRWADGADEEEKMLLNGLPTSIPMGLTKEQEEQYLLQLQIEEITRRLRTGELGIPKDVSKRSPSPEPIYGVDGKRMNTREFRTRKKLEEERHALILRVMKANPDYKPPNDYKIPNIKVMDKVFIPQEEHPGINFIGLLLGPRGNTLKQLISETGAAIVIRGKGSVKEGKLGFKDGKLLPGQDEPLHAYITSTSAESVKSACDRVRQIIKEGIDVPDIDNELRKKQLRELALLNGTIKDGDALFKLKQIAEAQTIVTNTIICSICGGAGHIANDCKQKRPGEALDQSLAIEDAPVPTDKLKLDSEYLSLMAELGQDVPANMMVTSNAFNKSSASSSAPASSSVTTVTPGWQSYPSGGAMPPMWGGNYMGQPWGPMPIPYGVPCYGPSLNGPPSYNPMYGAPYMPPMPPGMYGGSADRSWTAPGFPMVPPTEDWNQVPPLPSDQDGSEPAAWNPPPPPTEDLPPPPSPPPFPQD